MPVCDKCHKVIHKTDKYMDFKPKDNAIRQGMLITVRDKTAKSLKKLHLSDNETYDSIINRLLNTYRMVTKEK